MMRFFCFVALGLAIVGFAGCNRPSSPAGSTSPAGDGHDHGHDEGHDHGHDHGHAHDAGPHGGHVIELGDHQYHVEWTHDDTTGKLAIYLLDGAMEKPVAIEADSLVVNVKIGDQTRTHELAAAREDDSATTADHFTTIDKPLIEALKLAGQGVDVSTQLPIDGQTFDVTFEHEEH